MRLLLTVVAVAAAASHYATLRERAAAVSWPAYGDDASVFIELDVDGATRNISAPLAAHPLERALELCARFGISWASTDCHSLAAMIDVVHGARTKSLDEALATTVILNYFARPANLPLQLAALVAQTRQPREVWILDASPSPDARSALSARAARVATLAAASSRARGLDAPTAADLARAADADDETAEWPFAVRLVSEALGDALLKFDGRFALAALATTPFVCVVDDDKIPGARWLDAAVRASARHDAIVGSNGRLWRGPTLYHVAVEARLLEGDEAELVEVDFLGNCWTFRPAWAGHLFAPRAECAARARAGSGGQTFGARLDRGGEDIAFGAGAQLGARVRSLVGPAAGDDASLRCDSEPTLGLEHAASARDPDGWREERLALSRWYVDECGWRPLVRRDPERFFDALRVSVPP